MRKMRKIEIKKKSGGIRIVYDAGDQKALYRHGLRTLAPHAEKIYSRSIDAAHAFRPGRSIVTNAEEHSKLIARMPCIVIGMDIASFFDSVTIDHLQRIDPDFALTAEPYLLDGRPRQGLPTSPAIANVAGIAIDENIVGALLRLGVDHAYTRYADDLTVTIPARMADLVPILLCGMKHAIEDAGFKVAQGKTRVQDTRRGSVRITGIMITPEGTLRPSRELRRKLRAAEHNMRMLGPNCNENSLRGLRECAKMKRPKTQDEIAILNCGKKIQRLAASGAAISKLIAIAKEMLQLQKRKQTQEQKREKK